MMSELDADIDVAKNELAEAKREGNGELIVIYAKQLNLLLEQKNMIMQEKQNSALRYSLPVLEKWSKTPAIRALERSSGKSGRISRDRDRTAVKDQYWLSCLLCGRGDGDGVTISEAHLLPANQKHDPSVYRFPYGTGNGFIDDLVPESNRNFIPLCGTKDQADTCHHHFDHNRLAILYDPFRGTARVHCPPTHAEHYEYLTNLHGREIKLPSAEDKLPYRRLIVARAVKVAISSFDINLLDTLQASVMEAASKAGSTASDEHEEDGAAASNLSASGASSTSEGRGRKRLADDPPVQSYEQQARKRAKGGNFRTTEGVAATASADTTNGGSWSHGVAKFTSKDVQEECDINVTGGGGRSGGGSGGGVVGRNAGSRSSGGGSGGGGSGVGRNAGSGSSGVGRGGGGGGSAGSGSRGGAGSGGGRPNVSGHGRNVRIA